MELKQIGTFGPGYATVGRRWHGITLWKQSNIKIDKFLKLNSAKLQINTANIN